MVRYGNNKLPAQAAIKERIIRQISLMRESTQPILSFAGLSWLASGVLLSTTPSMLGRMALFPSFLLILFAFFCARGSGMSFNRLIDAWIDAKNPRTVKRALPSGRAEPLEIASHAVVFLAVFLILCLFLPFSLRVVALIVSALLIGYSFTKRFTFLCHYVLGSIHFCLPITGALWVSDSWSSLSPSVWLASCAAFCSVASSDILYALQDEIFDRRLGLHSIPVRFGREKAIWIAACTYIISIVMASCALFAFHPTLGSFIIWGLSLLLFAAMWRSLIRSEFTLSGSLFSFLLPSLPFLFTLSVYVEWTQLGTM